MRRFLYITPYFPPQSKVGALRPLKFVRHLPELGWQPIVLCDLTPTDAVREELEAAVDPRCVIVRDYGWLAARPRSRAIVRSCAQFFEKKPGPPALAAKSKQQLTPPQVQPTLRWNPEWFPLGRHFLDMPHALRVARRVARSYGVQAIVVNADPYASLLIGERVAQELDLPWLADLRDPWGPCALRKPLRPRRVQRYIERTEARLIQSSSRYIINTDRAREDYQTAYPEAPPGRLVTLRNHTDPGFIQSGQVPTFPEFTLLFMGGFRRFVSARSLLLALSQLREKGYDEARLKLRVFGTLPASERAFADELGIGNMVVVERPRPYDEVGSLMRGADVLVSQSHQTDQRIPAKVYDYLGSDRPILHVGATNDELRGIFARAGGVEFCSSDEPAELSAMIEKLMLQGKGRRVERNTAEFTSAHAAQQLARWLDAAVAE